MPTSITLVATSTSTSPDAKRAITSRFSRACIWPCITADVEVARTRPGARRSPSAVAARACSASDSSTSGQTTKHCRPSRSRSRMNS